MYPTTRTRYVTSSQAAKILHISPKTLSRWAAAGQLTRAGVTIQHTVGGHRRYCLADLEALAARLTQEADA